jgi:hypothetical protein
MKTRSKVTGIIAALSLVLLAMLPQVHSENPVKPQNTNVPLFFMQPPEFTIGVCDHPFHAIVTADWNLSGPSGKVFGTEENGNVWRNEAGDVRVEGARTRNGRTPVQLPTIDVLFLASNGTMLSWRSGTTNVTSFRNSNLNNSNHIFENMAIPKAFNISRSFLYNCRQDGVECVTEPLGERDVEGIRVIGTRYKETIPAASLGAANELIVSRDVWSNPEMNIVVEVDGKDPVFGNFEMRLSSISSGPQDKSLFQIPQGYKEKDITPPPGLAPRPRI